MPRRVVAKCLSCGKRTRAHAFLIPRLQQCGQFLRCGITSCLECEINYIIQGARVKAWGMPRPQPIT